MKNKTQFRYSLPGRSLRKIELDMQITIFLHVLPHKYMVCAMSLFVHEVEEKHMSLSRVFLLYDPLDMAFINALCSAGTSQVINHLKLKLAKYF